MTFSNLTRWGGLAAVAAGMLFVISDLATLFFGLGLGVAGGLLFRSVVELGARVLLLLGLVGLYARRSEAVGILGLVGFLTAFVGLVLWQQNFVWAPVLANLGWALFGAASLRVGAYPRGAAALLIIGAMFTMVVNVRVAVQPTGIPPYVVGAGAVADIIFFVAVVWLGLSLFEER